MSLICSSVSLSKEEEKVVHVYFWADTVSEEAIRQFEKETGIKVQIDFYESDMLKRNISPIKYLFLVYYNEHHWIMSPLMPFAIIIKELTLLLYLEPNYTSVIDVCYLIQVRRKLYRLLPLVH